MAPIEALPELQAVPDEDRRSISSGSGESIQSKPDQAQHHEQEEVKRSDEPTEEERKQERALVRRLDACIVTWAFMAYVMKQVDSANYKTAYVSGMKEALQMNGLELNFMDTFFRVGYALFLIPSQIILTRVRPNVWLPSLEFLWGLCTLLMAFVPTVKGMYALRFFIGVFEASSFPGIAAIMCAWYTPSELAIRLAVFGSSYPAAQIFVGFMQAALHEGMEGKGGLPGWKWLFVFNALMTFIVAGAGFFLIPDQPGRSRVYWLSPSANTLSKTRMTRHNRLAQQPFTLRTLKTIMSSPLVYLYSGAFATLGWSQNANTWILLMLKSEKTASGAKRFGITQLNLIPIGGYLLQMLAMYAFSWASGRFGGRYKWILPQIATLVVGEIILSVWPASFGLRMFGFFVLWLSQSAVYLYIAWMSDLCPDPSERAVILGVAGTLVYVVDAFANIFIYPASKAPNFPIGYKAALAFALTSALFATGMLFWERRTRDERCLCNEEALCRQKEREKEEERERGCCGEKA